MINIFYDEKNYTLTIDGHAGYAKKGQDIVCAGVSTLAYTLSSYLQKMNKEQRLIYFYATLNDGRATIECLPKDNFIDEVSLVYDVVMNGLESIMRSYPDNVSIKNVISYENNENGLEN